MDLSVPICHESKTQQVFCILFHYYHYYTLKKKTLLKHLQNIIL